MWYLQSVTKASQRFPLVPGREMVVGRRDCDVLLSGDQSVSRRHATLCVSEGKPGVVTVTDCKSKFGTTVNGKRMGASEKIALRNDDIITFGQGPPATPNSKFRLLYEPLVLCCSAMAKEDTVKVRQLAKTLGAEVVGSWSERCSHLVMTSITVTVKVVCALSSCKPVVSPDWLKEAVRCHNSSLPLPSPAKFQPQVVDSNLINCGTDRPTVSFAPNYNRTALFKDHVFYFLSDKQLVRLKSCLEPAGATLCLMESPESQPLKTLVQEKAVVLAVEGGLHQQTTPTQQRWIQQVYSFLKSQGVRAVQDSEIGFALLYTSVEEYCNPRTTPTLPASDTPMAPPTLSQVAPPSQPHSSHHHNLTRSHTLPFTQDTQNTTHNQTTVLASESLNQSAVSEARSGSCSALAVNETIMTNKSPPDKSPLPDKSPGVVVKTEESSVTVNEGESVFKSPSVKSSRGRNKRPLPPSISPQKTQRIETGANTMKAEKLDLLFGEEEEDGDLGEGPVDGGREGGGEREEMMDTNQQGDPHTHTTRSPNTPVTTKPADNTKERSQKTPAKKQSPNLSSPEGSVIVPSSFTQRGQSSANKPPLPDSETLAFAFRGRRRKRELVEETPEGAGRESQANKKIRLRERERAGLEDGDQNGKTVDGSKNDTTMKKSLEKVKEGGLEAGKGPESEKVVRAIVTEGGGDTVPVRERGRADDSKTNLSQAKRVSKENSKSSKKRESVLPPIMAGLPLLETCDAPTPTGTGDDRPDTPPLESALGESCRTGPREKKSSRREAVGVRAAQKSRLCGGVASQSPPPTTQVVAPPTTPDPALFLSARKRRRKSPHDNHMTQNPALTQYTTISTQLLTTQRSRVFTPFTSLAAATGGRRTKATDLEQTNLWDDTSRNQLDGEDPLVSGANEEAPKRAYKPVCDEDGFVCSRIKPRVQTTRAGRLAVFADSQFSEAADGGEVGGAGGGASEPVAVVVFTRLAVMVGGRGCEDGRGVGASRRQNGTKNFKNFRKVQHIGQGAIPRLVTVTEYIAPTSRELQDWVVETENEGEGGAEDEERDVDSSQDLFRFTFSTATAGNRRRDRR